MPRPAASSSSPAPPVASAPPPYNGESSLEERILESDVVAKVRLVSATAVAGTAAWRHNAPDETSPAAVWEFRFRVLEYLKGTGANEITAVVLVRGRGDDTREDVDRALPTIAAERDTHWDSREAIVFLKNSHVVVPNTSQMGHYFMGFRTAPATNEDGYTIASRWDRLWLPDASAGASAASSGSQRFLLETPTGRGTGATGASGSTRTISLSGMKSKIASLNTELNRGDGSDAYKECVLYTYRYERIEHHFVESTGKDWGYSPKYPKHTFASGLAAGSSVHEDEDGGGSLPDKSERLWLDGGDADLFSVKFGDPIPYDWSGDGVNDSIRYSRRTEAARPLPEGEYKFHYNNRKVFFIPCDGYTVRYEWTVTVTAPARHPPRGAVRPRHRRLGGRRRLHQRHSQTRVLHRRQQRLRVPSAHRVGVGHGEGEGQPPYGARWPGRGLHRAGRLGVAVVGCRRRDRRRRQQHAELVGGGAALA